MSNYVIAKNPSSARYCVLEKVDNGPAELGRHVEWPLQPWPSNVRLHMDKKYPKNTELADWVSVFGGAIVASERLKDVIEKAGPLHTEYLPVRIVDLKGKEVDAAYFLINPYVTQDAIDLGQSIVSWNAAEPPSICDCEKMVLDESRIDPHALVFRLKHYPRNVAFARPLADAIKAAGFTGVKFREIHEIIS